MKLHTNILPRATVLAFLLGVSMGVVAWRPCRADWPLIRGDSNATGATAERLTPPLDIAWTYESDNSSFEATASIVDGIVYIGDVDGTFHAVNLADGTKAWTRTFEDTGFICGSAVADGMIYCVDYNGIVYCLDAKDGEPKWQYDTQSSLYAPPNVLDSVVLIVTDGGQLISLDAASGEEKWKFTIDQPLRCWPTVVEGRVLVAGCDGLLHAVDVQTGMDLEHIDIGGPADGMPAVLGNRVYFCTAGGVFFCAEVNPLKAVWQYAHKRQSEEIHAAAASAKAIILGTHDNRVVALDPERGGELWTFPVRGRVESSPVIVGDVAIAATIRGRIHALDVAEGKELWQTDVGGRFTASPAVSDGRVVIGNDDGVLYCIR
jgi:outer membrane protein assembly factor BamB